MRLTRLGLSVFAADLLAFFGALISGNNLLYLVSGALAAFWTAAGYFNLRSRSRFELAAEPPDQIFQDAPFSLRFTIRPRRRRPVYPFDFVVCGERYHVGYIPRGGQAVVETSYRIGRRGRNFLNDLIYEVSFPFGFFRSRGWIPGGEVLVFPALSEMYGRTDSPAAREERITRPQRGVGDDFYGLRDYVEGEDSRLINWKLTAKTGKPLVKEYAHAEGRRVTVTVSGAPGPGTEERIAEAASLAKFHIDSGAEVRLVTDEGDIDFGHGLLHLQALLEKLALLGQGQEEPEAVDRPLPKMRPPAQPRAAGLPWLYLATAAAFGSLYLIEELNPLFLLLAGLVIPVGALFDWKKTYPLPKLILDLGALAVLLFAFLVDVRMAGMVRTVVHILLYVLAYSLWSPKTGRTLYRIFLTDFLIFFLASGQAVDLGYLPFFALYLLAAAAWLVRRLDLPGPTGKRPGWFRGVGVLVLKGLAAAALMFLVLPRVYSPRMQQLLASAGLTRFQNPAVSFAGLSERVDLGFFGPLRKNSARVMRVSFVSGPGAPRPVEVLRVRAAAFDRFQGRRWIRSGGDFQVDLGQGRTMRSREGTFRLRGRQGRVDFPGYDPARPELVEEFFIYPMIAAFVFSAGGVGALEAPTYSASFDINDTVYFPVLYGSPSRYRVHSQGDGADYHSAIEGYEEILRSRFLALPSSDPRWKQYAERRTAGQPTALGKAKALESWFATRFSYSLAAADNRQDLDSFLWSSQAGNCEYFATAMTLLLRHIGIPSRLAIGFLTTEWNEFGGFFEVRQSDAHAWVEAFLPDRGWTTFDPTPPDLDSGGGSLLGQVWKRLGRYVSAVEARWYRYVVGYDSGTQRTLFDILRFRWLKALRVPGLILLAAAALTAGLWRWKPWRRFRRRIRVRKGSGFYAEILARLEAAGLPRPIGQTPAAFAAEITGRRPDLAVLTALTERYYQVRYAGNELTPADREALESEIHCLAAALRAGRRSPLRFSGGKRQSSRQVIRRFRFKGRRSASSKRH
jgi:protein-glutamine gamma-glutamyltransferase